VAAVCPVEEVPIIDEQTEKSIVLDYTSHGASQLMSKISTFSASTDGTCVIEIFTLSNGWSWNPGAYLNWGDKEIEEIEDPKQFSVVIG
jgi:hypothetical protein